MQSDSRVKTHWEMEKSHAGFFCIYAGNVACKVSTGVEKHFYRIDTFTYEGVEYVGQILYHVGKTLKK